MAAALGVAALCLGLRAASWSYCTAAAAPRAAAATTLLNHILTAHHGKRIAVIENEYEGVDIDGLANPAPIIQTFYAEDTVFNDVKLDGVVTLVDAKHVRLRLEEVKPKGIVNEAVQQIAYADKIVVNKIDLVSEPEVSSLIDCIKNMNHMAHLKRAEYGKVDLDYVLGVGGFDLERFLSFTHSLYEQSEYHLSDDYVP
ncbi:hypothetical protein E2562_008724 [Oryza meyeriana var. granulata]|uniref:CobW/HypB/UreG nucleotide-binding domain-containing protein n=1 Tax=Oryza meyeriana var. granulata TaxID=110450 RepID=A0A6G1F5K3_9ORYZ|nr:hypothetical protein E2562_008724 [Oryza meyeriana var. granulata]